MDITNLGLESIKKQDNSFHVALTECVNKLRKEGSFKKDAIKKSFMAQIIKQYTGLNVIIHVEEGWNAWIRPPRLTGEHVLFGYNAAQTAGTALLDIHKKVLKGSVDIENAKVDGVFSELTCDLMISSAFLDPNYLSDSELSAIILHELGHAFTYFQFLTTIAYGALVINKTVTDIFATDNYGKKQIILKEADQALSIDENEQSIELAVETNEDNLEVLLISRFMRQISTRSNTTYYDVRNCEQLADVFAVKFGAGVDLARANHKLDLDTRVYGNENFFAHILSEAAVLTRILTSSKYHFGEILLSMASPKLYDDPKDRIAFIKFQLIDDLKRLPQGAKQTRKELLESIEEVETILKNINPRRGVLRYIHETFTKAGKSAKAQQDSIKKLESLLFNDLFYQSAKIKTMYHQE